MYMNGVILPLKLSLSCSDCMEDLREGTNTFCTNHSTILHLFCFNLCKNNTEVVFMRQSVMTVGGQLSSVTVY